MKFGEKLRKLREEQHITQEAAARACGVTVRSYVSYELNGVYPRHREVYDKLAELFGVDRNYLLSEDEEFQSEARSKYGYRGRKQAEALVSELSGLFAGGEMSDEDKEAVKHALQAAFFDAKEENKKYGRKNTSES